MKIKNIAGICRNFRMPLVCTLLALPAFAAEPQFELDPSPRAYTGGIYDEARRAWLFDLKDNEAARQAFKPGEWNQGRIQCQGDHIRTWVNGVKAAGLKDDMTLKGIIAVQVHRSNDNQKPGEEVRWRNIRLKELSPATP